MAKKCEICKKKLSENLFNYHPSKCDECWKQEVQGDAMHSKLAGTSRQKKKAKEPQKEHYSSEDKAESDDDKL